ncbi:MAG: hypothetical protein AAFR36_30725 [Bacteroidota bacterium]
MKFLVATLAAATLLGTAHAFAPNSLVAAPVARPSSELADGKANGKFNV